LDQFFAVFGNCHPNIVAKPVSASPAAETVAPEMSFEAALGELESIVEAMESGDLPLEESLGAYKRGVALVKAAHARLAAVEEQVKVLEEGVLKPLATDQEDP
jgi:exodeoxyribonuclease VII small subunit